MGLGGFPARREMTSNYLSTILHHLELGGLSKISLINHSYQNPCVLRGVLSCKRTDVVPIFRHGGGLLAVCPWFAPLRHRPLPAACLPLLLSTTILQRPLVIVFLKKCMCAESLRNKREGSFDYGDGDGDGTYYS